MGWVHAYVVSHVVAILTAFASILVTVHLLGTRRSPQSIFAWGLAVVFVPLVAVPLYFLFGTRKVRGPRAALPRPTTAPGGGSGIERVLASAGAPPAREGNALEVLGDGQVAYARLLECIRSAQSSIHLSFFILGSDETGRAILDALADRAKAGIEVRVIFDAVGSARALPHAHSVLTRAGAGLRIFAPLVHLPFRSPANLRSHRKLAVFDGGAVLTGGMNLAIEYMGPAPSPERWVDVATLIRGPVARDAAALFASDWELCGGKASELKSVEAPQPRAPGARAQLVASGPDTREDTLYDALLTALFAATRRVDIVTPYYVPDETLQRAVLLAARRGVRTRLVVPAKSNHALANFARSGFIRELLAAGVGVLAYPKGMVHAKAMVVDDTFAYLGSPNFDVRSLYLNYENAVFFYDAPEVAQVSRWVDRLADSCVPDFFDAARPQRWLLEQLARLVSPEI